MIRARNVLRADAACHSGDVLTPVERAVSSLPKLPPVPKGFVSPELLIYREGACKWSDIPEIRELLLSLKGNKNAAIR